MYTFNQGAPVTGLFSFHQSEAKMYLMYILVLFFFLHSNLRLAMVSVVAYANWRLSFNVSECKQSGPYELLSTVRLRPQVNALHAVFSMSGNECERCALLFTLM